MDKTPQLPRPRWVQVLGKTALVALAATIVLGLIFDATDPPDWVSRAVALAYAAIVVLAMLVASGSWYGPRTTATRQAPDL